MRKYSLIKIVISLFVFIQINPVFAQNRETISKFFKDQSTNIYEIAYKNSISISSEIKTLEADDSNFVYKIILEINYRGFVQDHKSDCFIYIKDFPASYLCLDSNRFNLYTNKIAMIEKLKKISGIALYLKVIATSFGSFWSLCA